jgi:hypothetical protein
MSDSPAVSLRDIKIDVMHELQDDFKRTIHYLLKSRKKWRRIENHAETSAHILMLFGTISTFASGIFDNKILSFIAGGILCLSAALLKLSAYCHAECLERNSILNDHLTRIHLKGIPSNTHQVSEV